MANSSTPRFTLRTLMWLILVAVAFFGGRASLAPQLLRETALRQALQKEVMAEAAEIRAEAHRAQLDAMSEHAQVEQLQAQLRKLTRQQLLELTRRSQGTPNAESVSGPAGTALDAPLKKLAAGR